MTTPPHGEERRASDASRSVAASAVQAPSPFETRVRALLRVRAEKPKKPNAQENQSRPAGRRRARRIHLGRARLPAGRRAHRHRGHFRHVGRRDQRRDAGRRARARRRRAEARKRLDDFWRAASLDGNLPALQRSVIDRLFSFTPYEGSPVQAWFNAVARYMSPYDLNPLNINPLRDLIERFVDFDAVRAVPGHEPVHLGDQRAHRPPARVSAGQDHRRRDHGVGLPAVPVSRGRDRRRALLGRRLHGQSGDLPVLRRDARPRTCWWCRSIRSSASRRRAHAAPRS